MFLVFIVSEKLEVLGRSKNGDNGWIKSSKNTSYAQTTLITLFLLLCIFGCDIITDFVTYDVMCDQLSSGINTNT